jgi:hypothetical protein
MKVSILLPTHNRSDVVPLAIDSLLAQSFTDFEVLVCGDGCTDSTAEVVSRYVAADARVRWFDLPKGMGLGYANRNTVLREARGELIAFMAHDDLVTSDHLALLVQAMEDPGAHFVYTDAAWVGREGIIVPAVFHLQDRVMREEYFANRWSRLPSSCVMHRREAFEKVGFWNDQMPRGGDLELWTRIMRAYGMETIRHVTMLTCLHFRAHWRGDQLAPDTEPVWNQLHQEPGRFSEAMSWPVPEGMVEQEAFWRRMIAEPEIVPQLRDACRRAVVTYTWHLEQELSVQRGLPPVAELGKKIGSLREEKAVLKAKLAERDAKLQRVKEELERVKRESKWPKWLRWLNRK